MYLYSKMSLLIVCKALSPKNIKSASNTKVEDFIPFLSYTLSGRILGDRPEIYCKGFGFYSKKQENVNLLKMITRLEIWLGQKSAHHEHMVI